MIRSLEHEFVRAAETVARQSAMALAAPVTVIDEQGAIAASSPPVSGDATDPAGEALCERPLLRVPFEVDGRRGEVLVGEPIGSEPCPSRLVGMLIELIANQAALARRLPTQSELKNRFILDLLRGALDDEAAALREGQILGMDLGRPRAVILIDAADFILSTRGAGRRGAETAAERAATRARLVIASIVSFFNLPSDTICGYIGDGEIAVLKASTSVDLDRWAVEGEQPEPPDASWANLTALKRAAASLLARLRRDTSVQISLGIGRYHPSIAGLARSYQDARAALSLGRHFHGLNRVHCLDELGVAAFVGLDDERTKIELAAHLLSPLDDEPELLQTLDVFFYENCCPSTAAQRLSIHRNTLAYRLDKIASLSGLDPRHFDDAVQIRLALVLRGLQGRRNPLCSRPASELL
ncbi:MAG TPA: helix-turn-helix domain-containing protein [Dehalococcoidia bacterium]|jgi:carbohydrate diacid regulator